MILQSEIILKSAADFRRVIPWSFWFLIFGPNFRFLIPLLDHVGKGFFGATEVPDAGEAENGCNGDGRKERGELKWDLAAEEGPAEAVDDSDHGIERVKQAPLLRDNCAAKTD